MCEKENEQEEVPLTPLSWSKAADGCPMVDLTVVNSPFLEGLKKPIRVVEYCVGGIWIREPRGADDPMPDHVIMVAGIYINQLDGRIGADLADVV